LDLIREGGNILKQSGIDLKDEEQSIAKDYFQ